MFSLAISYQVSSVMTNDLRCTYSLPASWKSIDWGIEIDKRMSGFNANDVPSLSTMEITTLNQYSISALKMQSQSTKLQKCLGSVFMT